MKNPFRVVALVSAYNEEDIIEPVVRHLIEQGVEVYLLDNRSTDGTVEAVRPWLGRGLLEIETLPSEPTENGSSFNWGAILRRKERLAAEIEADWFLHHDADEFREAPWPNSTLSEGISWVDQLGYNCIDFRVLNFPPVDDGFRPGSDPRTYFTRFEEAASYDRLQLKAWKKQAGSVLLAQGGHEARLRERRIFPIRFLLRHVPVRGQAHGLRKVFRDRKPRFLAEEREKLWHVQYDHITDEGHNFLCDPDTLEPYDPAATRLELLLENERARELAQEIERLRRHEREAAELQETIGKLEQSSEVQQTELTAARKQIEKIAVERNTAARELHATSASLRDERAARERSEEALKLSEERIGELERAHAELRDRMGRTLRDFENQLARAGAELDATRTDLRRAEAERSHLEDVILALADEEEPIDEDGELEASEVTFPEYGTDAQRDAEGYRRWLAQTPRLATLRPDESAPSIAVIVPVYRPAGDLLERAVRSVRSQTLEDWQLCLCDDGSEDEAVTMQLSVLEREDPRIRVTHHERNRGISSALNSALALADAEFVAFLDQDDELDSQALAHVTQALARDPHIDVLYTDEDKLDPEGRRCEPFFKPDWSPDTLLSTMYIGHLLVVRRSLVERLGGFRSAFDASQDYDLALRATEQARKVHHVPHVLYHWRQVRGSTAEDYHAKPEADVSARAALRSAVARRGEDAVVDAGLTAGTFRVRPRIRKQMKVTAIVPFRDNAALLSRCVQSLERGGFPNWEALLVDNDSWEPATHAIVQTLERDPRIRVLCRPGAFNWSAVNNFAASETNADLLLFLNDDVAGNSDGWLVALVEQAQREEIGVVGARLLYPQGPVQHAGVVLGVGGIAAHAFQFCPADAGGYFALAKTQRNVSAVTGACMMVRRRVFEELQGFDERLRVAYNDIDFCLRARTRGYRVLYTPFAELIHDESVSRGVADDRDETAEMIRRWLASINRDPYFNPNLSLRRVEFALPEGEETPPWTELSSTLATS